MRAAPALPLLALLALAACVSPRDACVSDAMRQLSIIDGLIRETQGNIARGYAVEEDQVVDVVPGFCDDDDDDEDGDREFFCDQTVVRDVARPVAIDLNVEQAKLDSLLERRVTALAERDARLQACLLLPDA